MNVHPDKTAWRAVDACGGVPASPTRTDYERGWDDALKTACEAVKKPDALTAELLAALELAENGLSFFIEHTVSTHPVNDESLALIRAVLAKATGEA